MSFGIPEGNKFNTAQNFENWTNSSENYNNAINNKEVEEFSMFEAGNLQTYSSDLKQFSQNYIDMWDTDGDGAWSKDEFIMMSTAGEGIPSDVSAETAQQYAELFDELYDNLNIDDKKDSISAGEFASYLYAADMDWENYAATGEIVSSVDGKLSYEAYQGLSSIMKGDAGFDQLQFEKADFYNYFYAAEEAAEAENEKPATADLEEPAETSEIVQKEIKAQKSDLPEGFNINENKEIVDSFGNIIGRVDISYKDMTNDGLKEKITEYFLYNK